MDNAKDLAVVMPMYNLIKYCDTYSKTSGSLWQYSRDEPADAIVNSKIIIQDYNNRNNPPDGSAKNVEIAVPLKYLSNF